MGAEIETELWPDVLGVYCCDYKHQFKTPHTYYLTVSVGRKSRHSLAGTSAQGPTGCSQYGWAAFPSGAWCPLPSSLRLLVECSSLQL